MIKTGIFGGTFNPIHNGHVALARTLLESAGLDEVWFVVSPQNPWKQNQTLLDDQLRLEMTRAALADEPRMTASDYEFALPRPSYMWNTLQAMTKDHPDREFILLIGGDNWAGFDRWYCYEEIMRNHSIVVYPRSNESSLSDSSLSTRPSSLSPLNSSPKGVRILETPLLDISSTDIRRRIKEKQPWQHLVPTAVSKIIEEKNLYV